MAGSPFHVCHLMPPGRAYFGLQAYNEHAQAVAWALRELGHDTSYSLNGTRPDAINVVMGAQMLAPEQLGELPPRTVIYNLEQMAPKLEDLRPVLRELARFPVWDFSEANLPVWRELGARSVELVRFGWAPVLERIPRGEPQDIEVLMYGAPSGERLKLLESLSWAGLRTVFACGFYDATRDGLIARARVIVNASLYVSRILEISRLSYLLANGKAVVSLLHPDTFVEPDIREAVHFAPPETIVQECLVLVEDDARRAALEEKGRRAMRARDMRDILRPVLARLAGA